MSSNPYPSTEVSTDPVAQYLDATGARLHLFEAAHANKLPATIHHLHLASLICNGKAQNRALVAREIEYACKVLQLKSVAYVPYTLQKGQVIDKFELWEKPRRFSSKSLAYEQAYERGKILRLKRVTLNPEFPKFYMQAVLRRAFLNLKLAFKYLICELDRTLPRKPRRARHTMNMGNYSASPNRARLSA
jgi:hypothetical protein